jgi:hypothetical protein
MRPPSWASCSPEGMREARHGVLWVIKMWHGQLQIQCRAERFEIPLGKMLQIPGAAASTESSQDPHQQQQPLGQRTPRRFRLSGRALQEGDQIGAGRTLGQGRRAVPTKPASAWLHQPLCV